MSKILEQQKKIMVWEDSEFVVTTPIIPHISKADGGASDRKSKGKCEQNIRTR